jgi:hypothetical protein
MDTDLGIILLLVIFLVIIITGGIMLIAAPTLTLLYPTFDFHFFGILCLVGGGSGGALLFMRVWF